MMFSGADRDPKWITGSSSKCDISSSSLNGPPSGCTLYVTLEPESGDSHSLWAVDRSGFHNAIQLHGKRENEFDISFFQFVTLEFLHINFSSRIIVLNQEGRTLDNDWTSIHQE